MGLWHEHVLVGALGLSILIAGICLIVRGIIGLLNEFAKRVSGWR